MAFMACLLTGSQNEMLNLLSSLATSHSSREVIHSSRELFDEAGNLLELKLIPTHRGERRQHGAHCFSRKKIKSIELHKGLSPKQFKLGFH